MLQALAGLLLLLLVLAVAPATAAPVAHHEVSRSPGAIEASWTRADFLKARPATPDPGPPTSLRAPAGPGASVSATQGPFLPADATALPQRLHGKVFFRLGGVPYECSGTLVESRNANSIFTAGHCVYDPDTGLWATDLVFVPGYQDGLEPLGRYAAISLDTTLGWFRNGDRRPGDELDYAEDIGVASLAGTPAADLGGAEKIAFDLNATGRRYTIYGYPGLPSPPYDGERLIGCRSTVTVRDEGTPSPMGASPCDMSHGASGGGWMTGGYLNSVLSYVYCDSTPSLCGTVFAPYFSAAAEALYTGPSVGGGLRPTIQVKYSPPAVVRKRGVLFKFAGEASTPVRFECRFDRRPFQRCGARTTIKRLTTGRHVLRVRAIDQTGQNSRSVTRRFRVSLQP